jgi:aspartyl-tRNA(Asn)/glutamyl-tRNA(Gln) amidotransferase subunit C
MQVKHKHFIRPSLVFRRLIRYNSKSMSTITTDDVRRLAQLSSLQLSDEETTHLQADLEQIVEYIDKLGELDTTGVAPTYQVTGLENVSRGDEVSNQAVLPETLVQLAPEVIDHSIKVPKVL